MMSLYETLFFTDEIKRIEPNSKGVNKFSAKTVLVSMTNIVAVE